MHLTEDKFKAVAEEIVVRLDSSCLQVNWDDMGSEEIPVPSIDQMKAGEIIESLLAKHASQDGHSLMKFAEVIQERYFPEGDYGQMTVKCIEIRNLLQSSLPTPPAKEGGSVNPGPCVVCGATNYANSMGGPSICPRCDCGLPPDNKAMKSYSDPHHPTFYKCPECGGLFASSHFCVGKPIPDEALKDEDRLKGDVNRWLVSEYLDDGRFGILNEKNEIIVGISAGYSKEKCEEIVNAHNVSVIPDEEGKSSEPMKPFICPDCGCHSMNQHYCKGKSLSEPVRTPEAKAESSEVQLAPNPAESTGHKMHVAGDAGQSKTQAGSNPASLTSHEQAVSLSTLDYIAGRDNATIFKLKQILGLLETTVKAEREVIVTLRNYIERQGKKQDEAVGLLREAALAGRELSGLCRMLQHSDEEDVTYDRAQDRLKKISAFLNSEKEKQS